MKQMLPLGIPVLSATIVCASIYGLALAQAPAQPAAPPDPGNAPVTASTDIETAILEWTPPALAHLGAHAVAKESFTLDRTMLAAAVGMFPDADADVKQAVAKLDGVSVHVLRFAAEGAADPAEVESIREAYHLRGWKHVMSGVNMAGTVNSATTDVWLVMDGTNVRGAVVLMESPKSLTLATLAGNLSPVDLLHLRGHFGIPRFEGDGLTGDAGK
jgi:hypothetical protein